MENPQPVDVGPPSDPDAHGRAALLLVESLIHGLTAQGVLSSTEAVGIMEIALDAQIAIADDVGRPTPSMRRATSLLLSIVESMKTELPR